MEYIFTGEEKMTEERKKEIIFYASQFHHNSSAIDDIDAERAILELLQENEFLHKQLNLAWR